MICNNWTSKITVALICKATSRTKSRQVMIKNNKEVQLALRVSSLQLCSLFLSLLSNLIGFRMSFLFLSLSTFYNQTSFWKTFRYIYYDRLVLFYIVSYNTFILTFNVDSTIYIMSLNCDRNYISNNVFEKKPGCLWRTRIR